jgi:hypothetical protein
LNCFIAPSAFGIGKSIAALRSDAICVAEPCRYSYTMAEEYGIRIRGQANPIPVNLEPLIWYWLREIAAERGIPLSTSR